MSYAEQFRSDTLTAGIPPLKLKSKVIMTAVVVASISLRKRQMVVRTVMRVNYAVRPLNSKRHAVVRLTEETERTFAAISDPANEHLFTVESARKAFAHID